MHIIYVSIKLNTLGDFLPILDLDFMLSPNGEEMKAYTHLQAHVQHTHARMRVDPDTLIDTWTD